MRVGLFGGSFDPIHIGHIELANKALKELNLDELWFIVAYDQALKDDHFASFEDRVALVEIAIKNNPKLKVITIEKELPKPSYTYNTIIRLKKDYLDYDFVWIMGSDNLNTLDKWYRIDDLKELIEFNIIRRDKDEVLDYKYIDFDNPASSTKIREGHFKYLDPLVLAEIIKRRLYIEDLVFSKLSDKRAKHSVSVKDLALEIAKYYDFDESEVYLASILHDITKELAEEESLNIMNDHYSEHLHYHHKVHHQFTAEYYLKNNLLIDNDNILSAIKSHTTGDNESDLAKLIFLSDKLERNRKYPVEEYIDLSKKDINKAFKLVKAEAESKRKKV